LELIFLRKLGVHTVIVFEGADALVVVWQWAINHSFECGISDGTIVSPAVFLRISQEQEKKCKEASLT
jgi:hypothetical protein